MSTPVDRRPDLDRRLAAAKQVADAVLYEGYVLYPYRASAGKNQFRWQFGVVAPARFCETNGSESASIRTEVVVEGAPTSLVHVRLRCLQVQSRRIERLDPGGSWLPVPSLDTGGQVWTSFDEAVEHQEDLTGVSLADLVDGGRSQPVELPGGRSTEPISAPDGSVIGRVVRERWAITGRVVVAARWCDGPYPLARLTVNVENLTDWAGPSDSRDEVVRRSLVAAHTLMAVDGGRFLSLLDPPQFAAPFISACSNVGAFPVLVGDDGRDDVMLASPIILYDHPAIAPESDGDMFDSTEIDEILALRVLTLTDDEKREARGTDPRSAAIVDRCDAMSPASFEALHGTFRSIRPVEPVAGPEAAWWEPAIDARFDPFSDTVFVGSVDVGRGTRVQLRPSRRSDAQDLFLVGRNATVEGVFNDVDGDVYLAVVVDDDPGADLHQWHGRYLYFHPDEVDVIEDEA